VPKKLFVADFFFEFLGFSIPAYFVSFFDFDFVVAAVGSCVFQVGF
jgi:hypothetical protein